MTTAFESEQGRALAESIDHSASAGGSVAPGRKEASPATVIGALSPDTVARLATLANSSDLVVGHALRGLRSGARRILESFDVVGHGDPKNFPKVTSRTRAVIHEAVQTEKNRSVQRSDAERAEADDVIFTYLEKVGGAPAPAQNEATLFSSFISGVRDTLRAGRSRRGADGSSAQLP